MEVKVVKVEKYEGAKGELFESEASAKESIIKDHLKEVLMFDQIYYNVDFDEQVLNLLTNREVVIQMLQEWSK